MMAIILVGTLLIFTNKNSQINSHRPIVFSEMDYLIFERKKIIKYNEKKICSFWSIFSKNKIKNVRVSTEIFLINDKSSEFITFSSIQ